MSTPPTLNYATPSNHIWPIIFARAFLFLTGILNLVLAALIFYLEMNVPSSPGYLLVALLMLAGAILFFIGQSKLPNYSRPWLRVLLIATTFQIATLSLCPGAATIAAIRGISDPTAGPRDWLGAVIFASLFGAFIVICYLPQLMFLILVHRHFKKHPQR
jgi:hypothetical protein